MRRASRAFGPTAALFLVVVLSVPAPVGARTVIDAVPLGISDETSFHDRTDEVAFPIPVPKGLTPRTLSSTVQIPVDMARGHLEAWSGDLLLTRIPLDGREEFVPVEIPLERARIRDGLADVTLRTVLTPSELGCPDWTERSLQLRDSEVAFDGESEAPRVLADFIPPVLERLEIFLPSEPSEAEAEAAAELATTAAARFGRRGLEVEVLPVDGPRARTASPFTRRVEMREDSVSRIALVDATVPTVEIQGDARTLAVQARSVSTKLRTLAVTDAVTAGIPLSAPRALITEASLDQLGIGTVGVRGVGTVTAEFGLDQTRLAAVAGEVTLELSGMYSPPPAGRSGLIVVTTGRTVLDSWVADQSGMIDRTVTIPAGVLGRYSDVSVELQTAGEAAACGLAQPLSLQIRGDSRVKIGEPSSAAPRGFESLPQALMPRVQVAVGSRSLPDVARAVRILSALQSLSVGPLRPEWVTVDELLNSETPGILLTSHAAPVDVPLPLELTGGRSLEVAGAGDAEPTTLRFYEDIDFASLQVVEDGGRALMVASSTSGSAELDRTLDWLDVDRDRWSELSGNVLFTAPGREPVQLSTIEALSARPDGNSASDGTRTALLIGSVAAVAGIALAGILWLATRQSRSGRRR